MEACTATPSDRRAAPEATRQEPEPTGIDYLGLAAATYEKEAGTQSAELVRITGTDDGAADRYTETIVASAT